MHGLKGAIVVFPVSFKILYLLLPVSSSLRSGCMIIKELTGRLTSFHGVRIDFLQKPSRKHVRMSCLEHGFYSTGLGDGKINWMILLCERPSAHSSLFLNVFLMAKSRAEITSWQYFQRVQKNLNISMRIDLKAKLGEIVRRKHKCQEIELPQGIDNTALAH